MIIDRTSARQEGRTFFYTGGLCKKGHSDFRYVCSGVCISCAREDQARYRADPEKREVKLKRGKEYYQENRERIANRTKEWRKQYPDRFKENSRKYHNSFQGRARHLFNSAKIRSGKRGREILIDVDWVQKKLEVGVCELSGLSFVFETSKGDRDPYAPSLDRIDNSKGYTKENCRVILWALNMAFSNWGHETYLEIAKAYLQKEDKLEYDL